MAGEGLILRKTREEKGWSQRDVEDAIKIRVRYLEALENEQYNVLPGPTYSKGFLRTYARHLGLNSDEIINLYNSSMEQEIVPEIHQPLTPIQSTPVWFKPTVLLIMALFAAAIVIGITYLSKMNNNPQVSDYKPTPLPTAPQTQPQNPPEQTQGNPQPPQEQQTVVYEGIVAELTFKEDCWLKVRVDGVIAEDGMNGAGTTKVLQGKKRIEFLTIGNAGGLTIKLNGKELPSLGGSREVVWNYVITEDTVKNL